MSRLYDAMKRVEAERDIQELYRRQHHRAPSRARSWWSGALVGFVAGLCVAWLVGPWPSVTEDEVSVARPSPAPSEVVAVEDPAPAPVAEEAPPPAPEPPQPEPIPPAAEVAPPPAPPPPAPEPEAAAPAVKADAAVAAPSGLVWIQVGTFREQANAERLAAKLGGEGHPAVVHSADGSPPRWTVRVGGYADRATAEPVRAALRREGLPTILVGP